MKYWNNNKILLLILISFLVFIFSDFAFTDEVDSRQKQALQAELEHSLVAPCCWNMTVDNHESSASHQVREKIAAMIAEGKTRDEILQAFVAQYGERILASPSQNNLLGKLAYWLIPLAIGFGIFVVGKTLGRLSQPRDKKPVEQPTRQDHQSNDSYWDKTVEQELKYFE